jgi:hypothetical protein
VSGRAGIPRPRWRPDEIRRLAEMVAAGAADAAIAVALGRSVLSVQCKRETLQPGEIRPAQARMRRCLACGAAFDSSGPGNRICPGCSDSEIYGAAPMLAAAGIAR